MRCARLCQYGESKRSHLHRAGSSAAARRARFAHEWTRAVVASLDEEEQILLTTTLESLPKLAQVINTATILDFQKVVRGIEVSREVANYAARIARAGRPEATEFVNQWVRWRCGPGAGQGILLDGKSHAALNGQNKVKIDNKLVVLVDGKPGSGAPAGSPLTGRMP